MNRAEFIAHLRQLADELEGRPHDKSITYYDVGGYEARSYPEEGRFPPIGLLVKVIEGDA